MGNCIDCKFFEGNPVDNHGLCQNPKVIITTFDHTYLPSQDDSMGTETIDTDRCEVQFVVGPKFGCIHFKEF